MNWLCLNLKMKWYDFHKFLVYNYWFYFCPKIQINPNSKDSTKPIFRINCPIPPHNHKFPNLFKKQNAKFLWPFIKDEVFNNCGIIIIGIGCEWCKNRIWSFIETSQSCSQIKLAWNSISLGNKVFKFKFKQCCFTFLFTFFLFINNWFPIFFFTNYSWLIFKFCWSK